MKRLYRGLTVGLLLTAVIGFGLPHATAQESVELPLFLVIDGQIYIWENGQLIAVTDDEGLRQGLAYSPDGTKLAFMQWSPQAIQAVESAGGFWEGGLPSDIALIDIATGEISVIAPQPENAIYPPQGDEDWQAIIRSIPAWSADGARLAWSETVIGSTGGEYTENYRVVVYELATTTQTVIAEGLPAAMIYSIPHPLLWGKSGILVYIFQVEFDEATQTSTTLDQFVLYDRTGVVKMDVTRESGNQDPSVNEYFFADFDDREVIFLRLGLDTFQLIDPATGEFESLQGVISWQDSLIAGRGPASAYPAYTVENVTHYVIHPETQFAEPLNPSGSISGVSVAADGQRIAYILDGQVYIWENLEVTAISLEGIGDGETPPWVWEIAWGAQNRRIFQS